MKGRRKFLIEEGMLAGVGKKGKRKTRRGNLRGRISH